LSVTVQSGFAGSPACNLWSASCAARCTASHGLGAHPLPAWDVREEGDPLEPSFCDLRLLPPAVLGRGV